MIMTYTIFLNKRNKLKRIPLDEETKLLYSVNELYKININSPPIYNYKIFKDLIK